MVLLALVLSLLGFLLYGSVRMYFGVLLCDFGSEFEMVSERLCVTLDSFLVVSGWLLLLLLLVFPKPGFVRRALKQ